MLRRDVDADIPSPQRGLSPDLCRGIPLMHISIQLHHFLDDLFHEM